jgi:hypothetical protein
LRITEIHHLVQQFVDNHKVVPYTLLLEFLEVLCEHLHELVQEQKYLGSICVSFCESEHIEVVVADVEVVDAFAGEAGWDGGALIFGLAEQNREFLDS